MILNHYNNCCDPLLGFTLASLPLSPWVEILGCASVQYFNNNKLIDSELIHHGKILRDQATLQDSGVKSGEMIHVVKKKVQTAPPAPTPFSDAELQQLNASLRTLGCTPNAPGWTRAMQVGFLNTLKNCVYIFLPLLKPRC